MDLATFFEAVRTESVPNLGALVYQYLLEEIIELRMAPGQKISIATISKTLNLSRTPVRTALSLLIDEGLVEEIEGTGFRVKPLLMHNYMALCEIRRILESNAAFTATAMATDEELFLLKEVIEKARVCRLNKDYFGFADTDAQFHNLIVQMSRNEYMVTAYKNIQSDIRRYRFACSHYREDMCEEDTKHALGAHVAIYRAMKNKFASVAKEVMECHINHTSQTVIDLSWDLGERSKLI